MAAKAKEEGSLYDPNPPSTVDAAKVGAIRAAAKAEAKTAPAKKKAKPKAPEKRPDPRATAHRQPDVHSALPEFEAIAVDENHPDVTADAAIALPMSERQQLIADIARIRSMRKPFGAYTQKLALPERPGYKRHWFSDEPGRMDEASANGWMQITDKEGKPVKRVVGRARDGSALYAFAMELPKIFWDEDMAVKNKAAQDRMDGIRKNPIQAKPGTAKPSDANAFYAPDVQRGLSIREDAPSMKPYEGISGPAAV